MKNKLLIPYTVATLLHISAWVFAISDSYYCIPLFVSSLALHLSLLLNSIKNKSSWL